MNAYRPTRPEYGGRGARRGRTAVQRPGKKRGTGPRAGGPGLFSLLIAAAAVISAVMLAGELIPYAAGRREYAALQRVMDGAGGPRDGADHIAAGGSRRTSYGTAGDGVSPAAQEPIPADAPPVDHAALFRINPDYTAVLWLPSLSLRYPVVRSRDNDEYLRRTFSGRANPSGCIFLDMDCPADYSALSSVIYGHNMKDGSMFGSLKRILGEPGRIGEDPYFWLVTPDGALCYEIFACYTTPVDSFVYGAVPDAQAYDRYVEDMRSSAVRGGMLRAVDLRERPRIVTLSTCYGNGHTHNLVVQGALCRTAPADE